MNNTDEETRYNIQCNIVEKYYKEYDNNLTEWKEVSDLELDLNDRIIIYFCPDSQKNIYKLYPKCGKIIQIIDNYLIRDISGEIINMLHENVSYFGDNRGYTIQIFKVITKKRKFED